MNDPSNVDADLACDLSINVLDLEQEAWEERVQRTDASLEAWRKVAAQRRQAWEEAQAIAAAEALELRQRWAKRAAVFVGAAAAVVMAFVLGRLPSTHSRTEAMAQGPEPLTIAAKVEQSPAALVTVPLLPPAVPVLRGTTHVWQDRRYQWVTFAVGIEEATWMRWRDGNGRVVLNDMLCNKAQDGEHLCRAGRSHARIAAAVAGGAAPGTWTVDVCSEQGCTTATSFHVQAPSQGPRS